MNSVTLSKTLSWIGLVLLLVTLGRLSWIIYMDKLTFESEIMSLLPTSEDSLLVKEIDNRVSAELKNKIVILIRGENLIQTDDATDYFMTLFDHGLEAKKIMAKEVTDSAFNLFSERVSGMLEYKDRLIADRSRQRMQKSAESQLNWRMNRVVDFSSPNLTDPVEDPFGTLEEFLLERMPSSSGVQSDGLYLRVDGDNPTNLLLIELAKGGFNDAQMGKSVQWILSTKEAVLKKFDVQIHISGISLHAATIRNQIIKEVRWMTIFAVVFSLGVFLYVTQSIRALLISTASIILAIAGGLVISHTTIGLPHLVGLTMAGTAIGICIDLSLHFWIHVRTGMSGAKVIETIRPAVTISLLTTIISLILIAATSIPALARSAVFVIGTLLFSWMMLLFFVPKLVAKRPAAKPLQVSSIILPKKLAMGLVSVIAIMSGTGLVFKYHTDDSPIKLGRQIPHLIADDLVVKNSLDISTQLGIYLVETNLAEELLEAENRLLKDLTSDELLNVKAISKLVITHMQQQKNQLLFKQAASSVDSSLLSQYLKMLNVPSLNWNPDANKQYDLLWVLKQPWALLERSIVLTCEDSICASMIHASGGVVTKLDKSCHNSPNCSRISFSERQISAFQNLRTSFTWSILLAIICVGCVLYFRYRNKAFRLMAVPVLAMASGVAAVAWAGMPITIFTLAATFLILGLSVDYVVFAHQSSSHSKATFLAIFASALTTSLSFWILFCSNTPAIQYFALPVAVGIPVAWIAVHLVRPEHA